MQHNIGSSSSIRRIVVAAALLAAVTVTVIITVAVVVAVVVSVTVALAKPTAENGYPKLGKIAALTITHSLLPRCAPTEKVADYKSMKKCTEWVATSAAPTTKVTRTLTPAAAIPTLLT